MKMPLELMRLYRYGVVDDEVIEAIVRDCAKVCEGLESDMGFGLAQQCASAILHRYGLA